MSGISLILNHLVKTGKPPYKFGPNINLDPSVKRP